MENDQISGPINSKSALLKIANFSTNYSCIAIKYFNCQFIISELDRHAIHANDTKQVQNDNMCKIQDLILQSLLFHIIGMV